MKATFLIILFTSISIHLFSQKKENRVDTLLNYKDINGLKQGNWKQTFENKKPKYEAYFVDDKPIGEFKRWDNSGNLIAVLNYDTKGEKANAVLYHQNGKVLATGKYVGQNKDSIWQYYDQNTICYLQESYKSGVKHGTFKNFTSEKILIEEINWKDGIKDGEWKKYYTTGPLMWKSTYVNGKMEGDAKAYFEDGKVYKEGKFVNDLMEGAWFKYKTNGSLEKVYQYKNGISPESEKENDEMMRLIDENKDKYNGPQDNNDVEWLRGGQR
jgi:antitoxin component YwqK of YwqJK toxin-antitoxin module